jgi:hypothetical protein
VGVDSKAQAFRYSGGVVTAGDYAMRVICLNVPNAFITKMILAQ